MEDVFAAAPDTADPAVESPDSAADPSPASDAAIRVDPIQPPLPTQPGERIVLIDILRGVALFGILLANMRGFAGPLAAYFHTDLAVDDLWKEAGDVSCRRSSLVWGSAFVDFGNAGSARIYSPPCRAMSSNRGNRALDLTCQDSYRG